MAEVSGTEVALIFSQYQNESFRLLLLNFVLQQHKSTEIFEQFYFHQITCFLWGKDIAVKGFATHYLHSQCWCCSCLFQAPHAPVANPEWDAWESYRHTARNFIMENFGEVWLFLLGFWGKSVEIELMPGVLKPANFELFVVLRLKHHTSSITDIFCNNSKKLIIFETGV